MSEVLEIEKILKKIREHDNKADVTELLKQLNQRHSGLQFNLEDIDEPYSDYYFKIRKVYGTDSWIYDILEHTNFQSEKSWDRLEKKLSEADGNLSKQTSKG